MSLVSRPMRLPRPADLVLRAAEEPHQRAGVVGHAQAEARGRAACSARCPSPLLSVELVAHRRLQHLLRLPHHGVDELLLDLDEQARQVDRRARQVVRAQLVARVGGLRGVDAGAVGELADDRDHERQPGQHDEQRDAALRFRGRAGAQASSDARHLAPVGSTFSVMWMRASVE